MLILTYLCIFSNGYHSIDEALLLHRFKVAMTSSHRLYLLQASRKFSITFKLILLVSGYDPCECIIPSVPVSECSCIVLRLYTPSFSRGSKPAPPFPIPSWLCAARTALNKTYVERSGPLSRAGRAWLIKFHLGAAARACSRQGSDWTMQHCHQDRIREYPRDRARQAPCGAVQGAVGHERLGEWEMIAGDEVTYGGGENFGGCQCLLLVSLARGPLDGPRSILGEFGEGEGKYGRTPYVLSWFVFVGCLRPH